MSASSFLEKPSGSKKPSGCDREDTRRKRGCCYSPRAAYVCRAASPSSTEQQLRRGNLLLRCRFADFLKGSASTAPQPALYCSSLAQDRRPESHEVQATARSLHHNTCGTSAPMADLAPKAVSKLKALPGVAPPHQVSPRFARELTLEAPTRSTFMDM